MAQELLIELNRRGIKLRLNDGRVDVVAPAGSLTPELREQLRLQRDALISLLRQADPGEQPPTLVPDPEHRYDPFPLTDIQNAYWVGRNPAFELGGVFTHCYFELERRGLDLSRLEESLGKVIDRHDMLRAIVEPDGRQRVLAQTPPYRIAVRDLTGMAEDERAGELSRLREEHSHRSLPPERWPLFDIRATRIEGDLLRLHFNFDNVILDAGSLSLLFQDWRRFYEEPDWAPEPLALSYRDFVLAEEAGRERARYKDAEEYWMGRLDTLPPAPALPLAKQPAQVGRPSFRNRHGVLGRERWSAVKRIARQRGVTPSAVLMTAFGDVLRLWTHQPEFTFDLTLFNRPSLHPQLDLVLGDFTSVGLLAVRAEPADSFTARARRLNQQLMRDLGHLAYSGVRVLQERSRRLGGGPGASMPIVFTSALVLGGDGEAAQDIADGRRMFGELVYSVAETPQVWLDHQAAEERGELILDWHAVDELFPDGLLDDVFATYRALLDRLSAEESVWDATGPLIGPPAWQLEERARANDSAADIPARTLCELVEDRAVRAPDAVAVIADDGRLTYHEAIQHAYRLANRLIDLGAAAGELVAVVLPKGWEQVPAVLGVTRSGAAYLPIDPDWPEARRRQLLEQGRVRIAVSSAGLRDELAWPPDITVVTLADDEVRAAAPSAPDRAPTPDDLAYVIFTSGSTGQPKGVMIDHRGAANTVQDINQRYQVGPADRVLGLSALSFDLSVYDVFGTLAAGGTLVLPAPGRAHEPAHWSELMGRHGVTVWNSVPALLQAWLDGLGHAPVPSPGLRVVMLSGDWIPVTLPNTIRAVYPEVRVISMGGATEASIWSVWYPIGEVLPEWTRIPYGKPLANQTLCVLDAALEPCPVFSVGEIYIGGTGVAKGYWADPTRTTERFIVHPGTGERLYRTGDLGRYLPGGDIDFLGRQDFQVKLNGYRIELGEIASSLRRLPGVGEAFATVDTNPMTGRRQLVAYVVPAPDSGPPPDPETLRAALEDLLPEYMVPRHYVRVDRVPLSANGKVDLSALPSPWDQTAPEQRVAPRNEVERKLIGIWRDTLGRDDFGVEGNLFELGGDSLHAVHLLGKLREEFGISSGAEEGLQLIFDNPTVARLAVALGTLES